MTYEKQKATLRSQVASEFRMGFEHDSIILDSITEKLMAKEFNQTFYRGDGQTTTNFVQSSIKLSLATKFKALLRGIGVSSYAITQIVQFQNRSNPPNSLGWVYAIPAQYFANREAVGNLEKFLDSSLKEQGATPPTKYFVQSGNLKNLQETERVEVVTHIGSKILGLQNQSKTKTIFELFKRTISWLKVSISHPVFLLVGPEYIVDIPAIKSRINLKREVLITTQSQLLAPALVFKSSIKANRVMYWYSDNSFQISKKNQNDMDYSYLTQPQISRHFVWTASWQKTLQEHNRDSEITPIGPIIFKTLDKCSRQPSRGPQSVCTVTIFDVTPKKIASSESIYSDEVMMKFLGDIIESVKTKYPAASINLKPKRRYSASDSLKYREFTKSQFPKLNVLGWDCDIAAEIINSDLVICIPFTSPGLISSYLAIQTAFYVPSVKYNLAATHENIPVIQGKENLDLFLEKAPPKSF